MLLLHLGSLKLGCQITDLFGLGRNLSIELIIDRNACFFAASSISHCASRVAASFVVKPMS
ncbi:hypothetical protein QWZ10_19980 [Paracoccus cavernae]|uniref:Uncharacterized protein n=1 Tax=Paracoccus cavernae TaxID=1571207 RepID=A0ABT8D9I6_9RHOB|nr:hypothetical protein [Paracoccus cavernae]